MRLVSLLLSVVALAAQWKYFQKMGREGWEGIIPLYNVYVLFQVLYDEEEAKRWWTVLIPIYNIPVVFRMYIALAEAFHKPAGFGVGLVFLQWLFGSILAFGDATFRDGSAAIVGEDTISTTIDSVAKRVKESVSVSEEKKDSSEE